jgi:hypothetical protein
LGEIPEELTRHRDTSVWPHRVRATGVPPGTAPGKAAGVGGTWRGAGRTREPYAPPSVRPRKPADAQVAGISPGDKVLHAKFGEGMVLGIEPGGVVRVFFSELGEQKRLLLEYAPLKRL